MEMHNVNHKTALARKLSMPTGDEFRTQLFALPAQERADLARQLLLSLEDERFDEGVQQAWAEEADRRSIAYEKGETESRDWQESVDEIRQTFQQRRRR